MLFFFLELGNHVGGIIKYIISSTSYPRNILEKLDDSPLYLRLHHSFLRTLQIGCQVVLLLSGEDKQDCCEASVFYLWPLVFIVFLLDFLATLTFIQTMSSLVQKLHGNSANLHLVIFHSPCPGSNSFGVFTKNLFHEINKIMTLSSLSCLAPFSIQLISLQDLVSWQILQDSMAFISLQAINTAAECWMLIEA